MWYGLYYREIFKPLELLNLFFHLTVAIYNQLRFSAFQRPEFETSTSKLNELLAQVIAVVKLA